MPLLSMTLTILSFAVGNSPDMNAVENVLSDVQARVADAAPRNAAELDRAFRQAWAESTTPEKLKRLFASYKSRLAKVISARGAPTKY